MNTKCVSKVLHGHKKHLWYLRKFKPTVPISDSKHCCSVGIQTKKCKVSVISYEM